MQRPWVRVAFSTFLTALFAAWTGAKFLLDWLGRVDAFKSIFAAESSVSVLIKFLTGTPAWLPAVCALALTAATIWLISRPLDVQTGAVNPVLGSSSEELAVVAYTPTRLLLQFQAGGMLPRVVREQNIDCWHAYSQVIYLSVTSETGEKKENEPFSMSWAVFIAFDGPVKYQQMLIDGGGSQLPPHKIEVSNQRYAIVNFWGDLAGTTVNFQLVATQDSVSVEA